MDRDLWYRIGLHGTLQYVPGLLAYARSHPSFWHPQSYVVAANCVQITKKFYDNPDLPPEFRGMKRRAMSNAYLRGIGYARIGHHWKTAFTYALYAVLVDPTNARNAFGRLKSCVAADAPTDRRLWWMLRGLELPSLPQRVLGKVKRWMRGLHRPRLPNLLGDRNIEWSWVTSQMPSGPGEALDFGSGGSHLALVAAQRGFTTTAVDLQPLRWPYVYPGLALIQGDILKLPLPQDHFDLIINCSTIEHVGLAGRYGVMEGRTDGDLEAMACLHNLLKSGGTMLLTLPVGQDAVFAPLCRIYGVERLPRLLDGYIVEKETFWVKDQENRWRPCDRETALDFEASAGSWDPLQNVHALGCFVLRKSQEVSGK
jgi:SAM-dependent methyltransferase